MSPRACSAQRSSRWRTTSWRRRERRGCSSSWSGTSRSPASSSRSCRPGRLDVEAARLRSEARRLARASRLSPEAFRRRTHLAERELQAWAGEYDLVFQLQTLFAPGTDLSRPYVIYTDNTYTLTWRHYRAWAPLSEGAARERRALEKATFRSARVVFGMSEWVCEAIVSDYGCEPERVVLWAPGERPGGEHRDKAYARRIAIFVGNKYELKGVPTLLEAWKIVRQRLPDALLWIVGVDSGTKGQPDLPSSGSATSTTGGSWSSSTTKPRCSCCRRSSRPSATRWSRRWAARSPASPRTSARYRDRGGGATACSSRRWTWGAGRGADRAAERPGRARRWAGGRREGPRQAHLEAWWPSGWPPHRGGRWLPRLSRRRGSSR